MPKTEEWAEYFAASIKSLRASSGLTVSGMAEEWGVDERTYRKYERGMSSPPVIEYCATLDRLDAPILRTVLNFLHPDTFGEGPQSMEHIREALTFYVNNIAPDRILRQVNYNLLEQAADNIAPQMELISALQHMPLIYRVMICRYILGLWDLLESRGELVNMDVAPPDIDALRQAADKAAAACKAMRDGYKLISDDDI